MFVSKELKELNETYKHSMYRALAWTLGTFVTLFTTLTVAMLAAEGSQTQSWEWKFEWINVVSWEVRIAFVKWFDSRCTCTDTRNLGKAGKAASEGFLSCYASAACNTPVFRTARMEL